MVEACFFFKGLQNFFFSISFLQLIYRRIGAAGEDSCIIHKSMIYWLL